MTTPTTPATRDEAALQSLLDQLAERTKQHERDFTELTSYRNIGPNPESVLSKLAVANAFKRDAEERAEAAEAKCAGLERRLLEFDAAGNPVELLKRATDCGERLAMAEAKCAELEGKIERLIAPSEVGGGIVSELTEKLAAAELERDSFSKTGAEEMRRADAAENRCAQLEREIVAMRSSEAHGNATAREHMEALQQQVERANESSYQAASALSLKQNDLSVCEAKLAEETAALTTTLSDARSLLAERDQALEKLSAAERELAKATDRYKTAESDCKGLGDACKHIAEAAGYTGFLGRQFAEMVVAKLSEVTADQKATEFGRQSAMAELKRLRDAVSAFLGEMASDSHTTKQRRVEGFLRSLLTPTQPASTVDPEVIDLDAIVERRAAVEALVGEPARETGREVATRLTCDGCAKVCARCEP